MAFENIGIGGVLSFDSQGAVANMASAQRGAMGLQSTFTRLRSSVSQMGSGFREFQVLGTGTMLGLGFGLKSAVQEGIAFNKQMENARIAIGTVMSVAKSIPIEQALAEAGEATDKLLIKSSQTAGEMSDLVNIFKSIAGPMTKAGVGMDQLIELTGDAANAAASLGFDYSQVGTALSKLQSGTIERGQDFVIMLSGGLGLLKETTEEWRELTDQRRAERIQEMMAALGVAAEQTGNSWEGVTSTFSSLRQVVLGAFAKGIMEEARKSLLGINGVLFKNLDTVKATAEAWGRTFVGAIQFVVTSIREFVADVRAAFDFVKMKLAEVRTKLEEFGVHLDSGILKKVVDIGTKFIGWAAILSPIVPLIGFIGSKLMGIVSIAGGLFGMLTALISPIGAIIAAVTALFVMFPERMGAVMEQVGQMVMQIGQTLWGLLQALMPAIEALLGAVMTMVEALMPGLMAVVDIITVLVESVVKPLIPVLTKVIQILGEVFARAAGLFSKIFTVIAQLIHMIQPALEVIAHIVGVVLVGAFEAIGFIIQAIQFALEVVVTMVQFWLDIVQSIVDALATAFYWVADKLSPAVDALKAVFQFVGDVIDKFIIKPVEWLIDALKWVADKVADIFTTVQSTNRAIAEANRMRGVMDEAEARFDEEKAKTKKVTPSIVAPKEEKLRIPPQEQRPIENNIKIHNKTDLCVDGRKMATATDRHKTEIQERAGFNAPAWQTRLAKTQGVRQ